MKLILKTIKAKDLLDTGSMLDKQDPAIEIKIGKQVFKTQRQKDAGVVADFPEIFECEISQAEYEQGQISLEALNIGLMGGGTSLGSVTIPLKQAIPSINLPTPITFNLKHVKKGSEISKGIVTLIGEIKAPQEQKTVAKVEAPEIKQPDSKQSVSMQPIIEPKVDSDSTFKKSIQENSQKKPEVEKNIIPDNSSKSNKPIEENSIDSSKKNISSTKDMAQDLIKADSLKAVPTNSVPSSSAKSTLLSNTLKLTAPAKLIITKIQARDLQDTGNMLDKQDPAVEITIGKQVFKTQRAKDSGINADFTETFEIEISPADFDNFQINVEALNIGLMGGNTSLGAASAPLNQLISSLNTIIPITFNLKYIKKGNEFSKGTILFSGELKGIESQKPQKSQPNIQEQQSSKKEVIQPIETSKSEKSQDLEKTPKESISSKNKNFDIQVNLLKASVSGVKSAELMLLDKNDLYVTIESNINWAYKTETLDDIGSNGEWTYEKNNKDTSFMINIKDLSVVRLNIKVFDANSMRSDTLLGETEIYFPPEFISNEITEDKTFAKVFPFDFNDKKKTTGKGEFTFLFQPKSTKPETTNNAADQKESAKNEGKLDKIQELQLEKAKKFKNGILKVKKIICLNLPNVESMGGKNDPYVVVSLAGQKHQTEILDEAGSNATFEFLDFKYNVDRDILDFETFKVEVFDKNNFNSDKMIGDSSSKLDVVLAHIDEEYEMTMPLKLNVKSKSNNECKVLVYLELTSTDGKAEIVNKQIEENLKKFTSGQIEILRIRVSDMPKLRNEKIFVNMNFGDWKWKSPLLDLSNGISPIFDNVEAVIPISNATLLTSTNLSGELFTQSMMGMMDSSLGAGACSLALTAASLNQETEIECDLVRKGGDIGKLIIFAKLVDESQLKKEIKIDDSFIEGFWKISRVEVNGLKNTELLGKQDPYVLFEYKDTKGKTHTLDNKGGDCTWENLDIRCENVQKADILNDNLKLKVSIFDDNTLLSDTMIGMGEVSIKESAITIGKEISLVCSVKDKKNKTTGRVNITFSLNHKPKEVKNTIPKDLTSYFLKFERIIGKEIKNSNFISKFQPNVEIKYSNWSKKTPISEYDGENKDLNVLWDHLNYETEDFPVNQLTENTLQFMVYDGNKVVAQSDPLSILSIPQLLLYQLQENDQTDNKNINEINIPLIPLKNNAPVKGSNYGQLRVQFDIISTALRKKQEQFEQKVQEEIEIKSSFVNGEFLVSQVKVSDLTYSEFLSWDKIDPYIVIEYMDSIYQSNILQDSGNNVIFNDIPFRKTVYDKEDVENNNLKIYLYEANKMTSNVLLGIVSINLKRLLFLNVNSNSKVREIEFTGDIYPNSNNSKGSKKIGSMTVQCTLKHTNDQALQNQISSFTQNYTDSLLTIQTLNILEIINQDFMNNIDPMLTIKLNDTVVINKFKIDNPQGKSCNNLIIENVQLHLEILKQHILFVKGTPDVYLIVELYDDNVMKDTLLGSGKILLRHYFYEVNKLINLPIKLFKPWDQGYLYKGQIIFQTTLFNPIPISYLANKNKKDKKENSIYDEIPKEKYAEIFQQFFKIVKMYDSVQTENKFDCVLSFHRIEGKDLKNMNWIPGTKPDPYCEVNIDVPGSDIYKQKTNIAYNIENNQCRWNLLDIQFLLSSKEILEKNTLEVLCKNKNNLKGDDLIGGQSIKLINVVNYFNQFFQYQLDLINPKPLPSKEKEKSPKVSSLKLPELPELDMEITLDLENSKKKKTGQISLFVTLLLGKEAKESIETEKDLQSYPIPDSFQYGLLKINRIDAVKLKNTESMMFDKQDPYIVLNMDDIIQEERLPTMENAGDQCSWKNLPFEYTIYRENMEKCLLDLQVLDENTSRSNTLIGKNNQISFRKLCKNLDMDDSISVNIYNDKSEKTGKITIYCRLENIQIKPKKSLPETFKHGMLSIHKISLFNKPNTNKMGNFLNNLLTFNKITPYVMLEIPETDFKVTTKPINAQNNNPTWDVLNYQCVLDKKNVSIGNLILKVMDKNSVTSDTEVGQFTISLTKFIESFDEEAEIVGDLLNSKSQPIAKVIINGKLESHTIAQVEELDLPKDFTVGVLKVLKLKATGLKNTEWLGKQDPFAKITVDDWTETTSTLVNAGSNPSWPNLEIQAEVNREMLTGNKLKLEFCDQNSSRKDIILGSGSVSFKKLCESFGSAVDLPFDLTDSKNAICGKGLVTAMLVKGDPSQFSDALPETAVVIEKGLLKIIDILGFDLKGGDAGILMGGQPDPYVTVQLGTWSNKTTTLKDAGRNPNWNSLTDMEVSVTSDILKFQRLQVLVMDKNVVTKDSFMGKGDISLRKLGSQPGKLDTYIVRLKDGRGRSAGRLELKALVEPVQKKEEPANTAEAEKLVGKLQFSQCTLKELRNTAMISKQDIFVKLSTVKWQNALPLIKDAGTEANWKLFIETGSLAGVHLLKQGLKVEVMAKGMTGDSLVGQAQISLQPIMDRANQWFDVKENLQYEGKQAGKLILKVRFATEADLIEEFVKGAMKVEENGNNNGIKLEDFSKLQLSQDNLSNKVSKLEAGLKAQLKQELINERQLLMEALEAQNKELKANLDKMMKAMKKQQADEIKPEQPTMLQPPQDLQLPKNVSRWRSAHVQAWLAFEMELPQYLEAFNVASIDGLVLLNHIDRTMVQDHLNISDPLHIAKIMNGIEKLKIQQLKYDQLLEQERLKRLKLEEEMRLKKQKELLKAKKDKKKKKKKKVKPQIPMGDLVETNGIDRVKIENALKKHREEMKKKQQKVDSKSKTWHFEYTGQPPPRLESMWDGTQIAGDLSSDQRLGTATYQKVMQRGIVQEIAPLSNTVRSIPENCSTDEVLAVVKATMFQLSSWLIEVERMNQLKQNYLDQDLDEMDYIADEYEYDEEEDGSGEENDEYVSDSGEEDENEDPPAYDALAPSENSQQLPTYENVLEYSDPIPYPSRKINASNHRIHPLTKHLPATSKATFVDTPDLRMTLIFNSFINQQNNKARWLGTNDKLTRLKLFGGFESLLKLKLSWGQFDMLWTRLDYKRTGDIDLNEFKAFFGNIDDFESLEGVKTLNIGNTTTLKSGILGNPNPGSPSHRSQNYQDGLNHLVKLLYEFCDVLRKANFTVVEIFSGFDRNASGETSISEFISLMKLALSKSSGTIDKPMLYKALTILDSDGNKAISLQELMIFIYRVWKTQILELNKKINTLQNIDHKNESDEKSINRLLQERYDIKEAIKKNFPRPWRDKFEREGNEIPGPFQNLLKRMNLTDTTTSVPQPAQAWDETRNTNVSFSNTFDSTSPSRARPQPPKAPQSPSKSNISQSGHNQLLRFKIKIPQGSLPIRGNTGTALRSLDNSIRLTDDIKVSGERTGKILTAFDHMNGMM